MKKSKPNRKEHALRALASVILVGISCLPAMAETPSAPVTQQEIDQTQKNQLPPDQLNKLQKNTTDATQMNPLQGPQPAPIQTTPGQQGQKQQKIYPKAPQQGNQPALRLNPFAQQQAPKQQKKGPQEKEAGKKGREGDQKAGGEQRKLITDNLIPPKLKPEEEKEPKTSKAEQLAEQIRKNQNPPQIIYDEGYQPVIISLKEITRVLCFAPIDRVVYSKEKPFEIKTVGKDAFIKNIPFEVTDPIDGTTTHQYDRNTKELYIVCGNRTYSLILVPSDIPAQTIYLKTSYVEKETAGQREKALPYEDGLLSLIKDAYMENVPDGYDVEEVNNQIRDYEQLSITHTKTYSGDAYQILEFMLTAKTDLMLDEITFLSAIQPKNPIAVSLITLSLKHGEQTRAYIVRLMKDE